MSLQLACFLMRQLCPRGCILRHALELLLRFCVGAAMAGSSLSVMASSLMLRNYRPPPPVLRDVNLI